MPKVRVSISGLGKDFIRIQASTIQALAEKQVEEIARETEIVIRQKIRERIEREGSTDNLATSFFAVPIVNGWGVGDIDYLNTHAKYWYWQNFGQAQTGRTIPPSTAEFPRNRGSFAGSPPESGGGNQRWGKGKYPIYPKKAIEAKNYIQATINEINQIVSSVVRRITL